jgi:hypothetical protein
MLVLALSHSETVEIQCGRGQRVLLMHLRSLMSSEGRDAKRRDEYLHKNISSASTTSSPIQVLQDTMIPGGLVSRLYIGASEWSPDSAAAKNEPCQPGAFKAATLVLTHRPLNCENGMCMFQQGWGAGFVLARVSGVVSWVQLVGGRLRLQVISACRPLCLLPPSSTQFILIIGMYNRMKMTKRALLVILATVASHASAGRRPGVSQWKPPTPTEALDPHDRAHLQISPRPTDLPLVRDAGELRRRDSASTSIGSNTCGFWTDDGKQPTPPYVPSCTLLINPSLRLRHVLRPRVHLH